MMQQLTMHLLRMMDCLPLKEPVLIIRKGIMCGRFKLVVLLLIFAKCAQAKSQVQL